MGLPFSCCWKEILFSAEEFVPCPKLELQNLPQLYLLHFHFDLELGMGIIWASPGLNKMDKQVMGSGSPLPSPKEDSTEAMINCLQGLSTGLQKGLFWGNEHKTVLYCGNHDAKE